MPDVLDRLLKYTEENQRFRIEITGKIVTSQIRESGRGQIIALGVLVMFVAVGIWCTVGGYVVLAGMLFGAGAVEAASLFLKGRKIPSRDLAEKRKMIMSEGGGEDNADKQ